MNTPPFKKCPNCDQAWQTRDDFLDDPNVEISGFQASFAKPESGLFLFNHVVDHCHTTMSLPVKTFADLYIGPHHSVILSGTDQCQHKCLSINVLELCSAPCANAAMRTVAQTILKRLRSARKTK